MKIIYNVKGYEGERNPLDEILKPESILDDYLKNNPVIGTNERYKINYSL